MYINSMYQRKSLKKNKNLRKNKKSNYRSKKTKKPIFRLYCRTNKFKKYLIY